MPRRRILLLGGTGQLGHELAGPLALFADVIAPPRSELDLTALDRMGAAIERARPDILVNAASYNDVERAESEPAAAMRVNAEAVARLGEHCKSRRIAMIHFSTDFVFDGEKAAPYVETDIPNPLNAYGRSKLAGERALLDGDAPALILRTAWLYGLRRKSFVASILSAARSREVIRVVNDQIGSPTSCRDLAQATAMLLYNTGNDPFARIQSLRGLYHAAGSGSASRHELACAVIELDPRRAEHRATRVEPIITSELPSAARRPARTPLDGSKLEATFGLRLPPWRDSLARMLAGSTPLIGKSSEQ